MHIKLYEVFPQRDTLYTDSITRDTARKIIYIYYTLTKIKNIILSAGRDENNIPYIRSLCMRENYANFFQIAKLAAGSKTLTCNKKVNLLVSDEILLRYKKRK